MAFSGRWLLKFPARWCVEGLNSWAFLERGTVQENESLLRTITPSPECEALHFFHIVVMWGSLSHPSSQQI